MFIRLLKSNNLIRAKSANQRLLIQTTEKIFGEVLRRKILDHFNDFEECIELCSSVRKS